MLATVGFLALTILALPGTTAEPARGSLALGGALAVLSGLFFFNSGFAQRARGVATLLVAFVALQFVGSLESLEPYRSQLGLANWLVGLSIFLALVMGIENLTQWKAV